jgi:hypothetical protein
MSNLTKKDFAILSALVTDMSTHQKKISKSTGEELELEIRIPNLSREDFRKLYREVISLKHIGKIEESLIIPIIESTPQRNYGNQRNRGKPQNPRGKWEGRVVKRKEMIFQNGKRLMEKDRHIEKSNITRFAKGRPEEYVVKLAKEKVIPEFTPSIVNEYRFRMRSSILVSDKEYPELDGWRLDFTYVRMLDKQRNAAIISNLPEFRNAFFGANATTPVGVANFLDFEPENVEYEVELEYVGDPSDMKIDSVAGIKDFVSSIERMMPIVLGLVDPRYYERVGYHQLLMEIVTKLMPMSDALEYKNRKTLKNLVNRPHSFTIEEWRNNILPDIDNYYVSDKADGERCFIVMGSQIGGNADSPHALLLTADRIIRLDTVPVPEDYWERLTVCDAEVLDLEGGSHGDIYLFDVLLYKGKNITRDGLVDREKYLDTLDRALGTVVHKKPLVRMTSNDYGKQIRAMYTGRKGKRGYPVDGLVFTQALDSYSRMKTYKWKPADELTIDFLVIRAPKSKLVGVKQYAPPAGHSVFWLFSGSRTRELERHGLEKISGWQDIFTRSEYPNIYRFQGGDTTIPIQFSTSSDPYAFVYFHPSTGPGSKVVSAEDLHGHVAEFTYGSHLSGKTATSGAAKTWQIKNMRPDKDIEVENGTNYGNSYKVALDTFTIIKNPVSIDDLAAGITGGAGTVEKQYFQEQKSQMYRPGVKFNSFVVAQLLRQLEGKDWIIDLAAGRGNHLFTYNGYGIKNGIFVDIDAPAIDELARRKESFHKNELYLFGQKPDGKHMKVYTKVADVSKPHAKTLEIISDIQMPPGGVDAVIMTFAIHYILDGSVKALKNLIDLVDGALRSGGVFIFTCFDGDRVSDLLSDVDVGDSWDIYEPPDGGVLKYSIKKLPSTGDNERVSVIHPFSHGEYYEENLVRISDVLSAFEKRGYVVQQNGSFGDWLDKFKQFNNKLYRSLSVEDKLYSGLYQYVTLWKK